jgi:hypothetical protein
MLPLRTRVTAIYVHRSSRNWVVRDADGNYWRLPQTDCPWDDREPFHPDDSTELEAVPGHYKYMLDLPC